MKKSVRKIGSNYINTFRETSYMMSHLKYERPNLFIL